MDRKKEMWKDGKGGREREEEKERSLERQEFDFLRDVVKTE